MLQEIFAQHREQVLNAFPSVFTKDDVIKILEDIQSSIPEPKPQSSISAERIEKLKSDLLESIYDKVIELDSDDVVDFDSAEFEIRYLNTVELNSIDWNSEKINDKVEEAVDEVLHDFFTPEEN